MSRRLADKIAYFAKKFSSAHIIAHVLCSPAESANCMKGASSVPVNAPMRKLLLSIR